MSYPLVAVFAISLAVVVLIFLLGSRGTAKGATGGGKTEPYACGEDLPAEESKIDLERFLIYAVYFLIFDILAFVLATSSFATGLMPVAYISVVLLAVGVLVYSRRHV